MASIISSTCWPTRFVAKWLALFFGATLLGLLLAAFAHKQAAVKPLAARKRVQVNLEAFEVYSDDTKALVPASVSTGGVGDKAVPESDQGKLSIDPRKLTPISRFPGEKLWLIFQWQNHTEVRLINPWPQSTIPYTVEFHLNRPNPHPARPKTAH